MTHDHRYIGGPLNGQRVEENGEYWDRFRDSQGRPVEDRLGDADMYSQPADERKYYYWVGVTGHGLNYVHHTLMETMLTAWNWESAVASAFPEEELG